MKAPLRYPKLTRPHVERLREIERAYHVRAFGEELARVNLDLTKEERIRYLEWMRENARKHGVKVDKPPPYGLKESGDSTG
jgi:hypothetical protein